MQQYQVPQFITIEDRIIGPLTLRQFLYLLGGGGVAILGWSLLHPVLFFILALPIAGLFIALAFARINDRPFATVLFAAINYYLKPRLYLWRQAPAAKRPAPAPVPAPGASLLAEVPKLSQSKLDDLAWSLDIKGRIEERG